MVILDIAEFQDIQEVGYLVIVAGAGYLDTVVIQALVTAVYLVILDTAVLPDILEHLGILVIVAVV